MRTGRVWLIAGLTGLTLLGCGDITGRRPQSLSVLQNPPAAIAPSSRLTLDRPPAEVYRQVIIEKLLERRPDLSVGFAINTLQWSKNPRNPDSIYFTGLEREGMLLRSKRIYGYYNPSTGGYIYSDQPQE
jgi:hypothetical protein